ncbi:CG33296, partial [Drosophila busckii]
MVYETSYESGRRPFKPDLQRGKWDKPTDYIVACLGLALKNDILTISYWFFFDMGLFGILPYYLYMVIYLVPILVIHSFMGQFSSSGFISAFRVSPFFKGMGYVSLALSIASLMYYSIFAIVPLLFILNSLRPTLPWSCEAAKSWGNLTTVSPRSIALCAYLSFPLFRSLLVSLFSNHFEHLDTHEYDMPNYSLELSWPIFLYALLVWGILAFIFTKFAGTEKFGKLLRYMIIIVVVLMTICLGRFLFLPGAMDGLLHYVKPRMDSMLEGSSIMPIVVLQAFGSGWGTVMSLSSHNDFKTNIMNYSWIIGFGQILIYILFGMVSMMLDHYYTNQIPENLSVFVDSHWMLYLSSATALASLELPHMWTILYYTMLLLGSLTVMSTQIFTIVSSLLDEFEWLRERRQQLTYSLLGILAVGSMFFCTNHGFMYFSAVMIDAIITHSLLHLLLLLAVLWVYGRERFQRDIEFMLGEPFASWKIFILRLLAPIFLLYSLLIGVIISKVEHVFSSSFVMIMSIFLVLIPLLYVPGYGFYIMLQNTGRFCDRFRRACRPNDWYPIEMETRQKYEELVGNSDITHQLYEVTEDVD